METTTRLLDPATLARIARLRLGLRRRVDGRFVGAHQARGFGSSLEFSDYRDYTPGDDPRLLDPHAYARFGRRLIKLFEAEDTAALRVVVDRSASMGVGEKLAATSRAAAVLAAIATTGGDRARVLLVGETVDPGPWFAGPAAPPAVEARLLTLGAGEGTADLSGGLRRAHAEGPRGPIVLVSDLLTEDWEDVLRLLGTGQGDGLLVHLLGREDLEPSVRGDVRLTDSESGASVEASVDDDALGRYAARRDAWLDAVDRTCGSRGVACLRVVDDEPVDGLLAEALRRGVLRT